MPQAASTSAALETCKPKEAALENAQEPLGPVSLRCRLVSFSQRLPQIAFSVRSSRLRAALAWSFFITCCLVGLTDHSLPTHRAPRRICRTEQSHSVHARRQLDEGAQHTSACNCAACALASFCRMAFRVAKVQK